MEPRAPSGLFPSPPPRPSYREPHPVRLSAVLAGAGVAAAWLLIAGMFASSASTYVWFTLTAAAVACACAGVLLRVGDRGVATGVALATALGSGVAMGLVVLQWLGNGSPV